MKAEWVIVAVLLEVLSCGSYIVGGTIAFIVLQKTKKQPIVLRNPREELHPRAH